jgi:hypothetical protein
MEHGRRPRPQPGSAAIPEYGPFCSAVDFDEQNDRECNLSGARLAELFGIKAERL